MRRDICILTINGEERVVNLDEARPLPLGIRPTTLGSWSHDPTDSSDAELAHPHSGSLIKDLVKRLGFYPYIHDYYKHPKVFWFVVVTSSVGLGPTENTIWVELPQESVNELAAISRLDRESKAEWFGPPLSSTPTSVQKPKNCERDKWLYEQRAKGVPIKALAAQTNADGMGLSNSGVCNALTRYADANGLPRLSQRKGNAGRS